MERYWNWQGNYIGVRQREYLADCDGRILGKFYGKEIYDQNGSYIGEIGKGGRLIKNKNKEGFRRQGFSTYVRGTITLPFKDCAPYPMLQGHEDFLSQ